MKGRVFFGLRVVTGAVFAYSGYVKLVAGAESFLPAVRAFELTGPETSRFLAHAIPWAEFVAGAFLVLGLWTKQSAGVLGLLSTAFAAAAASAMWRRLPMKDCGCFGEGISLPLEATLAVDLLLWTAIAALLAQYYWTLRFSLDRFLENRP